MKTILQRVASASVTVDKQLVSSIGKGLLVYAAIDKDDTQKEVESMASKVLKLKIWPDEEGGGWKRSVLDIKGEVLCVTEVVSQFTLLAQTRKGNKPDFHGAASGEFAKEMYDYFFNKVQALYETEKVQNGVFQAMMEVESVNDGPVGVVYNCHDEAVTLEIDTDPHKDSDKGKKKEPERKPPAPSQEKVDNLPTELLD